MKRRTEIIVVGLLAVAAAVMAVKRGWGPSERGAGGGGACCSLIAALDAKTVAATPSQGSTNVMAEQVVAYYLHATVRCETCLLIEKLAQIAVEQRLGAELSMNRLVFTSVNYELPENNHFLSDYKLASPSLVLVTRKGGKVERWKLLADTWELVREPPILMDYVETEVRKFLDEAKQPGGTNQVSLPPRVTPD